MKCKNKEVTVRGFTYIEGLGAKIQDLRCICSNDEKGKTLSIDNEAFQFTIPLEPLEEIFRGDYRTRGKKR